MLIETAILSARPKPPAESRGIGILIAIFRCSHIVVSPQVRAPETLGDPGIRGLKVPADPFPHGRNGYRSGKGCLSTKTLIQSPTVAPEKMAEMNNIYLPKFNGKRALRSFG